jgi:hypothetical protein
MHGIERRLGRLEQVSGAARLFVVSAPDDYDFDVEGFLREHGHAPALRDRVVRVLRFGNSAGAPKLISSGPAK